MQNTHVITVCAFCICILIIYHKIWPESSKVMGIGNKFMDDCINAPAFTVSVSFKELLYRDKVEIRNYKVFISYNRGQLDDNLHNGAR